MEAASSNTTIIGTAGGTGLTVLANIGSQDIAKTIVLAIVGAVVSFLVTITLKWLVKKIRNVSGG